MVDEGLRFVLRKAVRPELLITADTRPAFLCWSPWKKEMKRKWEEITTVFSNLQVIHTFECHFTGLMYFLLETDWYDNDHHHSHHFTPPVIVTFITNLINDRHHSPINRKMKCSSSFTVAPGNIGRPVTISKSMQPTPLKKENKGNASIGSQYVRYLTDWLCSKYALATPAWRKKWDGLEQFRLTYFLVVLLPFSGCHITAGQLCLWCNYIWIALIFLITSAYPVVVIGGGLVMGINRGTAPQEGSTGSVHKVLINKNLYNMYLLLVIFNICGIRWKN